MAGPHQGEPLYTAGTSLEDAHAAMILVHGRGASAQRILQMGTELHEAGLALLAPQADQRTWYPQSFLAPVDQNEPGRSSGLEAVGDALAHAGDHDVPPDRVLLVGFSQGACLASEFVARNPRRYGGLGALSGGLIGDDIHVDDYQTADADLAGTPAFLGCSDVDPHIPEQRVHQTDAVLEALGADVETRIYEGMGHTVIQDELDVLADLVDSVLAT